MNNSKPAAYSEEVTYCYSFLGFSFFEIAIFQNTLDEATEPWGVKVERVEVKDVRLPVQLQRAMAAEAEAAREARAKVRWTFFIRRHDHCLEV